MRLFKLCPGNDILLHVDESDEGPTPRSKAPVAYKESHLPRAGVQLIGNLSQQVPIRDPFERNQPVCPCEFRVEAPLHGLGNVADAAPVDQQVHALVRFLALFDQLDSKGVRHGCAARRTASKIFA